MLLISQYVYLWVHKNLPFNASVSIGDETFIIDKMPIYVGRGSGNRKDQHHFNKNQHYLSALIQENMAECIVLKDNLSFHDAVYYESYFIKSLGIKTNGGVLYNKSGGIYLPSDPAIISKYNLEFNTLSLILECLNSYGTIGQAAQALGVSARSMYRYMNSYKIESHNRKGYKIYEQICPESSSIAKFSES